MRTKHHSHGRYNYRTSTTDKAGTKALPNPLALSYSFRSLFLSPAISLPRLSTDENRLHGLQTFRYMIQRRATWCARARKRGSMSSFSRRPKLKRVDFDCKNLTNSNIRTQDVQYTADVCRQLLNSNVEPSNRRSGTLIRRSINARRKTENTRTQHEQRTGVHNQSPPNKSSSALHAIRRRSTHWQQRELRSFMMPA